MIEIYNYTNTIPPFMDIIVDGLSITQIEYFTYDADDDYEHITLYDDNQREFCNIVCDNFIII